MRKTTVPLFFCVSSLLRKTTVPYIFLLLKSSAELRAAAGCGEGGAQCGEAQVDPRHRQIAPDEGAARPKREEPAGSSGSSRCDTREADTDTFDLLDLMVGKIDFRTSRYKRSQHARVALLSRTNSWPPLFPCESTVRPPVSAIKAHRYHPMPDRTSHRHRHHRIRGLKISGYRSMAGGPIRKSARGQSKSRPYCASVPRDPLARPSIP